jgi:translation initiation factor IF-3
MVKKGDKVTVTLIFRGREKAHKDIGYSMMERILKEIDDVARIDTQISKMGSRLYMTVVPKKPGEKTTAKPAITQPPAAAH